MSNNGEKQISPAADEKRPAKKVCLYSVAEDKQHFHTKQFLDRQLQVIQMINNTPNWEYKGIYMDTDGKQKSFEEMMADCEAGDYDIIVTRTIRRFAGSLWQTYETVLRLAELSPPVEVIFIDEAIFTLDNDKMEDLKKLMHEVGSGSKRERARETAGPYLPRLKQKMKPDSEEGE